jgi:hypothetical protein
MSHISGPGMRSGILRAVRDIEAAGGSMHYRLAIGVAG